MGRHPHESDLDLDRENPYRTPQTRPDGLESASWPPIEPWRLIWTDPRRTIRAVARSTPAGGIVALAFLSGLGHAVNRQELYGLLLGGPPLDSLVRLAGQGVIGGLLGVGLFATLVTWTGRLLGGRGTAVEARAALAWSSLPVIGSLALSLPAVGYLLVASRDPGLAATAPGIISLILAFKWVLVLWWLQLLCRTLSEIHRFTIVHALGALFLGLTLALGLWLATLAVVGALLGPMRLVAPAATRPTQVASPPPPSPHGVVAPAQGQE